MLKIDGTASLPSTETALPASGLVFSAQQQQEGHQPEEHSHTDQDKNAGHSVAVRIAACGGR